jgi:RimJ/RimL family protein N-acetyltransferase
MQRDDFQTLCNVASDPDLWAQHPVPELVRPDVFTANLEDALSDKGGLTVLDRATGFIIGYSRFSQRFSGPEAVEIGWTMLARSVWGGRYNGDIKRAMLDHAFATFATVTFRVGEDNWRSRKALEKTGAALNGWQQDVESYGRVGTRIGYTLTREAHGQANSVFSR